MTIETDLNAPRLRGCVESPRATAEWWAYSPADPMDDGKRRLLIRAYSNDSVSRTEAHACSHGQPDTPAPDAGTAAGTDRGPTQGHPREIRPAAMDVDHKTVASVRREQVDVGKIPHVTTRTDTKDRKQPATKPTQPPAPQDHVRVYGKSRSYSPFARDAVRAQVVDVQPVAATNGSRRLCWAVKRPAQSGPTS